MTRFRATGCLALLRKLIGSRISMIVRTLKPVPKALLLLVAMAFYFPILQVGASPARPQVRVSCWYWLNAEPKEEWARDFKAMKQLGMTDVVLVWGLDAAAFSTREADSHEAIRNARQAGLGSYLFVWHARHNALPHDPKYQQVDSAGEVLFAFDTFDPRWRKSQWTTYLEKLAREYAHDRGFAGYIFDNSFAIGNIKTIDGEEPQAASSYLSYGAEERFLFGKPLPVSENDPAWHEWTVAREKWWADWAADTQGAIRSVDHDRTHQIVLEDGDNTLDPIARAHAGFDLNSVMKHFDVMSAYLAPKYATSGDSQNLRQTTQQYLSRMRSAIGPRTELVLSLRLSDGDTEDLPGHAETPTVKQIKQCVDAALASGVHRIDLYGYRMGIYHLDGPGWKQYQPGHERRYPLTGEIRGKFLRDRPELRKDLRTYLLSVEAQTSAN